MLNRGLIEASHIRTAPFFAFELLNICQKLATPQPSHLYIYPNINRIIAFYLGGCSTTIEHLYSLVTLLLFSRTLERSVRTELVAIKAAIATDINNRNLSQDAVDSAYAGLFNRTKTLILQKSSEYYIFHIVKLGVKDSFWVPSTPEFRELTSVDVIRSKCWALDELLKIMGNSTNLNITDNNERSPLMYASAAKGHEKMVELMLGVPGIDVNKTDEDGWTALMHAAKIGNEETIDNLLRVQGINLHACSTYNTHENAQWLAKKAGYSRIAEKLCTAPQAQREQTSQPILFSNASTQSSSANANRDDENNNNNNVSRKRHFDSTK